MHEVPPLGEKLLTVDTAGRGKGSFIKGMAPIRFTTLQWMASYTHVYG